MEFNSVFKGLIDKLSHSSYMFRHYCVILRELVVSTLPSYTSMSNAIAHNIIQNLKLFHIGLMLLKSKYLKYQNCPVYNKMG